MRRFSIQSIKDIGLNCMVIGLIPFTRALQVVRKILARLDPRLGPLQRSQKATAKKLHQTHDTELQEQRRLSHVVERRFWTYWFVLASVSVLTAVGLAIAWGKTEHVLLIGIPALVVAVAAYLTQMQRGVAEKRKRYVRLQAQVALQRSELRLNAVLNTVGEAIITVDSELRIVMANREALNIWGYPNGNLTDIDILDLIDESGSGFSLLEIVRLCDSDSNWVLGKRFQLIGVRKDGTQFPLELSIARATLHGAPHFTLAVRNISERVQAEKRIQHLAFYDKLTRLPNRQFFREKLHDTLVAAKRHGRTAGLLFIDLDGYERVNERFGHSVGDRLLREIAERLSGCVRDSDAISRSSPSEASTPISRLGANEFTVLLTEMSDAEDAVRVCRRVQSAFSKPITLHGHDIFVTTSIGITVFPEDGENVDTLLKNACVAMHSAKDLGPNRYEFFEKSLKVASARRLYLEDRLRGALEREEFELYYQPIHDAVSKRLVGAEALIRWTDPQTGDVSPGEFIPIAEDINVIVPIGEWVLRTACAQVQAWQQAGFGSVRMAVNLSAQQFKDGDLFDNVTRILRETGLPNTCLELEITERALMQDDEQTMITFQKLAEIGIEFVLDDFGTGYSSLSYLKRFPISRLKIDRSFVKQCATDPEEAALVSAIIALAHSLGLKVVAEGIETREQAMFLRDNHCDEFQGYLVGRPMPAEEFAQGLEQGAYIASE